MWEYYPSDGCPWQTLKYYANEVLGISPKLKRCLPERWRIKVEGKSYTEMWLRNYVLLRHQHGCTVLASQYANHRVDPGHRVTLVRDLKLDQKLLVAHAKMLKKDGETVRINPKHRHRLP